MQDSRLIFASCSSALLLIESLQSSELISSLGSAFASFSPAEKSAQIKKVRNSHLQLQVVSTLIIIKTNGVFEIVLRKPADPSPSAAEATWTIDLKKAGTVTKGKAPAGTKADVTIIMDDETFIDLASGKVCISW